MNHKTFHKLRKNVFMFPPHLIYKLNSSTHNHRFYLRVGAQNFRKEKNESLIAPRKINGYIFPDSSNNPGQYIFLHSKKK